MTSDSSKKPLLLLVEDDPNTLRLLSGLFKESYEILVAMSGHQGMDVARSEGPDLILLDLRLPDMDGLEICRILKAEPDVERIPIIFLTADQDPATEEKGITLGAVDFVTKPFSTAVLRARVRTHIDLRRKTEALERLAATDALTGVPNRRSFETVIAREWRRMMREKMPLSVAMVDIDHFKALNDTFGHPFGDHVLRVVAATIDAHLRRPSDYVARYGGEEFVLVLPSTDAAGAASVAEGARRAIEALQFDGMPVDKPLQVTASLGCGTVVPSVEGGVEALVGEADQNLYRAKNNGRNRVEPSSPA
ncbi:diguanylate cyclase [Roseospira visakhapatnamensis]|nr:diguanylate cyclase [Roseospira visakhapatnamensis]